MALVAREVPEPFLRWAGSKRWLIRHISRYVPAEFNDYYEPFLGSAAVFFNIADGHPAYLSDAIGPLIETFLAVRDHPEWVHRIASSWATDRETYYKIRAKQFRSGPHTAARFIYLNRLCFNGLYRENKSGLFNVPYGRPRETNIITILDQLTACGDRLRTADLRRADFQTAMQTCKPGDLVYLDPPYAAGHRSNGFVDYNSRIFDWRDQGRLADTVRDLDDRGVYIILTNADHESVRELYRDFKVIEISRHSSMSSRTATRGSSSELIILGNSLLSAR
jgi:DNA adenine methylase